jgi:hypothetical protein
MDLKSAKKILDEIFELCYQLEDQILSESIEGIYNDISSAKSIELVISSARELMVFVWESPDDDFSADIKNEIENLYNNLLEEYDEI